MTNSIDHKNTGWQNRNGISGSDETLLKKLGLDEEYVKLQEEEAVQDTITTAAFDTTQIA